MSAALDAEVTRVRAEGLTAEVDALLDAPEPEADFRDARQPAMLKLLLLSPPDTVIDPRA
ncbi:hypothetical protein ACFXGA_38805 [Actinosynnema sp. NPDC059335]|uniref:hypothetical protein n=1 Tax=Actinosynnema sp. NPDC059335 TaxID=3346804 RepID=UPI00366FA620